MKRLLITSTFLLCCLILMAQQRFVYLTTDEVRIDSVLPHVGYQMPLPDNCQDSVYSVSLLYPEYILMAPSDVRKYHELASTPLPAVPHLDYSVVYDRKKPILKIGVTPMAMNEGKEKFLVSFMLKIESAPKPVATKEVMRASQKSDFYAAHSVLASGRWAKIKVRETGVHQLTETTIRKAGFSDISKVKIYGYGGNLQPEAITAAYLQATDDLQEVEQCIVGGKHLFYAKGPVSYSSPAATTRTRNPYSDYGCYFITQSDEAPLTVDEATFTSRFADAPENYHTLYEVDGHAWYEGGRNLFDTQETSRGQTRRYTIKNDTGSSSARLYINVSAGDDATVQVTFNGSTLGTQQIKLSRYDKGNSSSKLYKADNLKEENEVAINVLSGGPVRLDYICLTYPQPRDVTTLSGKDFPAAEYMHNITTQDRHADGFADMVIIIPTSQKLRQQAERLKAFHEEHDNMRVTIVPADELYNEFSSGTPDANAYRRYMKMLYDKASSEDDMPKHLLLFGDCLWDNRMLTPATSQLNPDDFLLCFESENSFNQVNCFIDDGFFCLLDEGEGANPQAADLLDISVGRFPVTTDTQAKILVDKTISYARNENGGAWQNVIMFMGDDGNQNLHMEDANAVADETMARHPEYVVKKVMWDTYERQSSANGHSYPDVTTIIKKQQQEGALIMDYAGHGSPIQISHEQVLRINDFASFTNSNLPLWVTASCDIMPFDGTESSIGETAVLNAKGGAVAFFGTTRTVYANYNKRINRAFMRYVLDSTDGKPNTIGEAQRLAKNHLIKSGEDQTTNKLQFSLLGDPALALARPQLKVVIDSINGRKLSSNEHPELQAGSVATVCGHIVADTPFNGTVTAVVRDTEERIVCRLNDKSEADTAFVYTDRTKTLYQGSDRVSDSRFRITFAVSNDMNYSHEQGLINVYASSEDRQLTAHGCSDDFLVGGTGSTATDSIGPAIYCYLNSPSFVNGGNVNATPYFVAEITDEDGINATGNGIGHDLTLIIDGDASKTYNLNDNFAYDFGSYTRGRTFLTLPQLEEGEHTLLFRAWDIFNNPSTTQLRFNVVKGLQPSITSLGCTDNPASEQTTFILNHNLNGAAVEVVIDVTDMSGRLLWRHQGTATEPGAYTCTWNLTTASGQQLPTGVYIYRARVSCEGSDYDSKSNKLIITR